MRPRAVLHMGAHARPRWATDLGVPVLAARARGGTQTKAMYRIMAIDHGILSFTEATLGQWPQIVVTNPKDARFLSRHEPFGLMAKCVDGHRGCWLGRLGASVLMLTTREGVARAPPPVHPHSSTHIRVLIFSPGAIIGATVRVDGEAPVPLTQVGGMRGVRARAAPPCSVPCSRAGVDRESQRRTEARSEWNAVCGAVECEPVLVRLAHHRCGCVQR